VVELGYQPRASERHGARPFAPLPATAANRSDVPSGPSLEHPAWEPTNNGRERALRQSVIQPQKSVTRVPVDQRPPICRKPIAHGEPPTLRQAGREVSGSFMEQAWDCPPPRRTNAIHSCPIPEPLQLTASSPLVAQRCGDQDGLAAIALPDP